MNTIENINLITNILFIVTGSFLVIFSPLIKIIFLIWKGNMKFYICSLQN